MKSETRGYSGTPLAKKLGIKAGTMVTQDAVRGQGLDNGFVDYKIAAVDATWSGLRFARRK